MRFGFLGRHTARIILWLSALFFLQRSRVQKISWKVNRGERGGENSINSIIYAEVEVRIAQSQATFSTQRAQQTFWRTAKTRVPEQIGIIHQIAGTSPPAEP